MRLTECLHEGLHDFGRHQRHQAGCQTANLEGTHIHDDKDIRRTAVHGLPESTQRVKRKNGIGMLRKQSGRRLKLSGGV